MKHYMEDSGRKFCSLCYFIKQYDHSTVPSNYERLCRVIGASTPNQKLDDLPVLSADQVTFDNVIYSSVTTQLGRNTKEPERYQYDPNRSPPTGQVSIGPGV